MFVAKIVGSGACVAVYRRPSGYTPHTGLEVEVATRYGHTNRFFDFDTQLWSGSSDEQTHYTVLSVSEIKNLFTDDEVDGILDSAVAGIAKWIRRLQFRDVDIDVLDASTNYATFIGVLRSQGIIVSDARKDELLLGKPRE